uniref:Uncharacterized protein n=1 Tax=Cucumis melo TaxID=3656 RepID=A0A9I9E9H9_CUCME
MLSINLWVYWPPEELHCWLLIASIIPFIFCPSSSNRGATRLADGLAADARRRLRLGFGVRETAAPTDARLRRSAWTILPARLEARRRLGCDCGSAALLNREGCLAARVRGGGGVRRLGCLLLCLEGLETMPLLCI